MVNISPIRTEEDHEAALSRLAEIFQAEIGTPEGDERDILADLVELYEDKHYPIGLPDPISAIKFRMDQANLTPRTWCPSSAAEPGSRRCFRENGPSLCPWPARCTSTWEYPPMSSYRNQAPACRTPCRAWSMPDSPSDQWSRKTGYRMSPTCWTTPRI